MSDNVCPVVEVQGRSSSRSPKLTLLIGGKAERLDPLDGEARRKLLRHYPMLSEEALLEAVAAYEQRQEEQRAQVEAAKDPRRDPPAEVRGKSRGVGTRYPTLGAALREADGEDFVHWDLERGEYDRVVCVDVDLTDEAKAKGAGFTQWEARKFLHAAAPLPRYSWLSRSGGWHGVFVSDEHLTGLQRAGLWVLMEQRVTCSPRVKITERVTVTRGVPEGGELLEAQRDCGARDLRAALLRTGGLEAANEDDVAAWLADRGMEMGRRYEHEFCQIAPDLPGARHPVVVTERGLKCHRCGPVVPWSRLVTSGDPVSAELPVVVDMARNLAHWEHAAIVLAAEYPTVDPHSRYLREGYRALMLVLHVLGEEDPERRQKAEQLVTRALSDRLPVARAAGGGWLKVPEFNPASLSDQSVGRLPWATLEPLRADFAKDPYPLEGLPPVDPVLHVVDRPTWRGGAVLVPRPIPNQARAEDAAALEVDYAGARDLLRDALPGVTDGWLDALLLLTVAALRAQLELTEPPCMLMEMPSGSGKGAVVAAVGGVIGVPAGGLDFSGDAERCQQSMTTILERRPPIAWIDEAGKVQAFWRKMGPILKASDTFDGRQLYKTHQTVQVRSALLIAGSTMPPGIDSWQELHRRGCWVHWDPIPAEVTAAWPDCMQRVLRVRDLKQLRRSVEGLAVAQAYVDEALRHVSGELPSWPAQATELGGTPISDSQENESLQDLARSLYSLWRTAPDEAFETQGARRGWLRCYHSGRCDEGAALLASWIDPEASAGDNWGRVGGPLQTTPLPHGLRLEVRQHGRKWHAKFSPAGSRRLCDRRDPELFPAWEGAPRAPAGVEEVLGDA